MLIQMRLYLPGVDCLAEVVSGKLSRAQTGPVSTVIATVPQSTVAPATTVPPVTVPGAVVPPTTAAPKGAVVRVVDPGTTIAPTDTNPATPVVGADPQRYLVYDCARGVPASVRTVP